jgi:di/tricarboxylate transporter
MPIPADLPVRGWHVFAVFIAVITSFILRPYPIGAMVIFGLVALTATNYGDCVADLASIVGEQAAAWNAYDIGRLDRRLRFAHHQH